MSGRPPTITSRGKNKDYEKRWNNWTRPLRKASNEVNKKLLIKAFEVALKLVMKNHIFTFNNENFKQLSGGAIGVSIAGDVANLFMVWWDRELKTRLNEERIVLELYSRYVDDGNIAVEPPEDLRFRTMADTEAGTMEQIKTIANSIHWSIQVKVDFPSKHENKRVPTLDTEMWLEEVDVGGTRKHQILYSYYEKEMSSRYLVHKNTAIPQSSKMNILVNELLRVMRNTSLRIMQAEKDSHVQHFITKMQLSGYNQEDRIHVYQKAKRIFAEKVDGKEVYPHVDKFARQSEMTREKIHKKRTWFKNGRYKSVFYVDATPDGSLANDCQKILNRCELPVKVMEKTGDSLKSLLTKSNPFKSSNCEDPSCPVCLRECGINCRSSDVVYQNYCEHHETCKGIYDGETADKIKERFKEHIDDARLRPDTSAMQRHAVEQHNGEAVEFKVKILGSCPGDALLRQCMEAVAIRDENPTLNGRTEWGTGNGTQKRKRTTNKSANATNTTSTNNENSQPANEHHQHNQPTNTTSATGTNDKNNQPATDHHQRNQPRNTTNTTSQRTSPTPPAPTMRTTNQLANTTSETSQGAPPMPPVPMTRTTNQLTNTTRETSQRTPPTRPVPMTRTTNQLRRGGRRATESGSLTSDRAL